MHIPLKEFLLLATLMDNAGRVLTRRQLLDTCWAPGHPDGTKTLDVHIKRVREHLAAADPALRNRLRTVRGMGYVFDVSPSRSLTPPAVGARTPALTPPEPTAWCFCALTVGAGDQGRPRTRCPQGPRRP